jgi:phosphoribosylformylglycinamidine synthase
MKHEDIHLASAKGVGNLVVLYGARTGGDGIGGVSVLASETFDADGPAKRPAVQVGDPFMEKLLIEATLEVLHAGLVEGIQDLGGAGISCATSELASNGEGGMHVWLDRVPLRDATLSPEEILMSESQERMCAVVQPANIDAFMAICAKWDVEAVVIGEVNASGRLTIDWHGECIVDVPPRTVAHEGPVYNRPMQRPAELTALQNNSADDLLRPTTVEEIRSTLLTMIASPNLASKSWITDQYDRYVLGNTVLAQPEDVGMVRIDEESGLGVAVSTDCNGRFTRLDPYAGAQLALAEAYRNVAVSGARPLAVTNCLNFGSPEDPEVMWTFAEAVRGLADGCLEMNIPVTGGNVSFYNSTGDTAILPTPVVGVLGVIDDVERRTPIAWGPDGELIYLLGDTREEFGGSEWAHVMHHHLGGVPPRVDLDRERLLADICIAGSRDGMVTAAHDVSDGGVAQTLVEMALRSGVGARLWLPDGMDAATFMWSESAGRAIVVLPRSEELRFTEMCAARGLPATRIGVVDSGLGADTGHGSEQVLQFGGLDGAAALTLTLAELSAAHEQTLPQLFA